MCVTATQVVVVMGNGEYDSNVPMNEIALEQFKLHPDEPNLMVTVYEHAGWFLSYGLVNNKPVIVETANDAAAITTERQKFWDRCRNATWKTLPRIKRPDIN